MNRKIAVRGIIVHDNKLLCFQLKPYGNLPAPDFWSTPGGGVDAGEGLLAALEREMIEETGIKPDIGQLLYTQQFDWHGDEKMEFFFYIKNSQDYLSIDLSKTSHGAIEIERFDFVDPSSVKVLPDFLAKESLQNISATTETKFFNYLPSNPGTS